MNKSQILTRYNKLRSAMRHSAAATTRLNKALGVAMSGDLDRYNTSATDCDCPDRRFRGLTCKHMLACQMVGDEQPRLPLKPTVDEINDLLFA